MHKPPRKGIPKERNGNLVKTKSSELMEPMKVFLRIRPLSDSIANHSCPWIQVYSNQVLEVRSPDSARANSSKALRYTFKHIFDENSSQKSLFNTVALPMVENVLQGKNSLLFTYGVTSSGKTYTMNGNAKDGGIMPRCLDAIFNSITGCQANKHIFKPDKMNGFELQTEFDAIQDHHNDLVNLISSVKNSKTKLTKKDSDPDLAHRLVDPTKVECVSDENSYAVFITYIEIYNNCVFDLLEDYLDENPRPKPLQTKIIREDSSHNMFVHGVTEVEVMSTEEAFEIFCRGQKRRRVGHTSLNTESSRSHSIFNIRVVQALLETDGEKSISKRSIDIGQLSLVDLAGSERLTRTNNTGMRLREAGNINNSLMTLRTCLELLRENQAGANKVIPYRESRLTHLFKNFFDGEGQVSMIVCLNPNPDNYEESLHVLKFAEMSQEVQLTVQTPLKPSHHYTPGRRQANAAFKNALKRLHEQDESSPDTNSDDLPPPTKQKSPKKKNWQFNLPLANEEEEEKYCCGIIALVDVTKQQFSKEVESQKHAVGKFRNDLVTKLKEGFLSIEELKISKSMLDREKTKALTSENKISSLEIELGVLKRKYDECDKENKKLKVELIDKDKVINRKIAEKDKVKEKFLTKTAEYQEKLKGQFEDKLRRQKTEMEMKLHSKDEKLKRVQRVLSDEVLSTPSVAATRSRFETPSSYVPTPKPMSINTDRGRKPVAVVNRRHRRSRSAGDVWLEHKPKMAVPLNTVMQPQMNKRKSVTKLTDAKDVTEKTSKYCLMTQNQDSDGDLETRLYKGDIIPTAGGGAQVMFNDVEVLKQVSPTTSPMRRPDIGAYDISASCSVAIEGHGHRLRPRNH